MLYRPRRPWWQRVWNRISVERQRQIRSWSYALTVNVSILLILALFSMTLPGSQSIILELAMGEDSSEEDVITISPEPEPSEPLPAEPDIPDTPTVEQAAEPVVDEGTPAAASDSSSLEDLSSDAERISETLRRVAAAGGATEVPVRISLAFSGKSDLDLHVYYDGTHRQREFHGRASGHIWYRFPSTRWGNLDVDANARSIVPHPCENVAFKYPPHQAKYRVVLNHFKLRGPVEPTPYVIVITHGKKTELFEGSIMPQQTLTICEFRYRHSKRYRIGHGGPSGGAFRK